MSLPLQVISKVFHSPAGLTRDSFCCFDRLIRLSLPSTVGVAEEVPARGVAGLCLVPDPGVGRVAHVDARVVALLARHRGEPPFDVEDAVAELLVPAEPLVAAVALADEVAGRRVERPLRAGVKLARRRDRAAGPALELRPGLEPAGPSSLAGRARERILRHHQVSALPGRSSLISQPSSGTLQ